MAHIIFNMVQRIHLIELQARDDHQRARIDEQLKVLVLRCLIVKMTYGQFDYAQRVAGNNFSRNCMNGVSIRRNSKQPPTMATTITMLIPRGALISIFRSFMGATITL